MKIKYIPNILSVSRIIISLLLPFLMVSPNFFISLYIVAGITDVMDGYIARKYKVESDLGSKLDSIADIFFYGVIILYLFMEQWEVIYPNLIFISAVILVRVVNLIIGTIKFKKPVMFHTIANKVSGLLVFLLPVFLWLGLGYSVLIVLIITMLASLEEMAIIIKTRRECINLNQKSIFCD